VTNTGNLTTATGAITTTTAAANGNISLTATTGVLTVGAAVTAGGSGTVDLTATGAANTLNVDAAVSSGTGTITAQSDQCIVFGSGGSITTGGNVNLTSTNAAGTLTQMTNATSVSATSGNLAITAGGGVGSSGQAFVFNVSTLTSDSHTSNGNQFLADAATAQLNAPTALDAGTGTITLTTGTFQITSGAGGNAIADTSPLTIDSPAILDLNGNNETVDSLNGNGLVTDNVGAATLTVTGGSFSGNIIGASIALTVAGSSQTLTLSGNDTYAGLTTINTGDTLQAGSATSLTAATDVSDSGTLDLNGNSISIGALNGDGIVTDTGAAGTVTVTGGGAFSGNITGANTALTVNGAGQTLTLSGSNNSYSGPTTITGGTLLVNGAITGTGAVSDSGILGGTGSLAGPVTVNSGGIITAGTLGGVGTLTVGSLTFNGGTYEADISGNTSDTIVTSGPIDLDDGPGAFHLNSVSGSTSPGTVFILIDNTAPASTPIDNPPLIGAAEGSSVLVNGQTYYFTYAGGDGNDFALVVEATSSPPIIPGGPRKPPPIDPHTPVTPATGDISLGTANTPGGSTPPQTIVPYPSVFNLATSVVQSLQAYDLSQWVELTGGTQDTQPLPLTVTLGQFRMSGTQPADAVGDPEETLRVNPKGKALKAMMSVLEADDNVDLILSISKGGKNPQHAGSIVLASTDIAPNDPDREPDDCNPARNQHREGILHQDWLVVLLAIVSLGIWRRGDKNSQATRARPRPLHKASGENCCTHRRPHAPREEASSRGA